MNKAIIQGNLGADPETKTFDNGDMVCKLRVATSRKWKDKETGEQKEKVTWHSVDVFGKQAESCAKYLSKGRAVLIEGEIDNRKVGEGDEARYYSSIRAAPFGVTFLGGGKGDERSETTSTSAGDTDIPF